MPLYVHPDAGRVQTAAGSKNDKQMAAKADDSATKWQRVEGEQAARPGKAVKHRPAPAASPSSEG